MLLKTTLGGLYEYQHYVKHEIEKREDILLQVSHKLGLKNHHQMFIIKDMTFCVLSDTSTQHCRDKHLYDTKKCTSLYVWAATYLNGS